MFEGEYELTFEEEAAIEQPANIYSIIRTLDFVVFFILIEINLFLKGMGL